MLLFCRGCGNQLIVEEGQCSHCFACNACPYVHNITHKVAKGKHPKLKEVDDVLGGAAAREDADSTAELCPRCGHPRAYFMQLQPRSADEPMTTVYKCCNAQCGHCWTDYGHNGPAARTSAHLTPQDGFAATRVNRVF
uniref:DNA-directed RNA polymerase III subunit RPC10 n=1 Tax=Catagonus wagneri TaxID=51154 RepID=A0A8C3YEG5_9CETA